MKGYSCDELSIEWPPNAPVPDIHCPICGRVVMNQSGGPNEPVCPHLDIVVGGGDVQWVRPEWQSLVDQIEERRCELRRKMFESGSFDEDELPDPLDAVIDADPEEPCLLVTCHTRGFACGPVEDTCMALLRPMRGAYDRLR